MTAAEQLQQQAIEKNSQEIAITLLDEGVPANTIKKATGLSVKDIKALKKTKKSGSDQ